MQTPRERRIKVSDDEIEKKKGGKCQTRPRIRFKMLMQKMVDGLSDCDGSSKQAAPHASTVSLLCGAILKLLVLLWGDLIRKHSRGGDRRLSGKLLSVHNFDG